MKPVEKLILVLLTAMHVVAVIFFVKSGDFSYLWAPLVLSVPVAAWAGVMGAKRELAAETPDAQQSKD